MWNINGKLFLLFITVLNVFTVTPSNGKLLFRSDREITFPTAILDAIQHFNLHVTNFSVFSEDIKHSAISGYLLKAFKIPVTILSLNSELPKYMNCVLLSKEVSFYTQLFKNITDTDMVHLIILLTWPVKNNTLESIFEVAWKHKIMKILGFVEQKNFDVNIYSYFPYGPNRCGQVGPLLLLDTWVSAKKNFLMNKLRKNYDFARYLMQNFYGCPIKLLVKNRPPDAALIKRNNSTRLKGSGGKILGSIKRIYNLTFDIHLVNDGLHHDIFGYAISNRSVLKVNKLLLTHQFDFAFGVFSYLLNYHPDTDFSHYFMIEKYAFHVPCGTVKVWTLWSDYYMEFSMVIWAIVVCLFIFFSVFLKIVAGLLQDENPTFLSFWENMFRLVALHTENTVSLIVRTNTMRFSLMLIIFYCNIMSVAYQASLKSFLMAPLEANSIQSWEQLERSDLNVTGTFAMSSILNKTRKMHPVLNKIGKRFLIKTRGEFSDVVNEVTVKQSTACLAPEGMIAYYNSMLNQENRTAKIHVCEVRPYIAESPASTFLVKKGSFFLTIVNRVTVEHMQAGYMNYFGASRTIKTSTTHVYKDNQVKFSLRNAKGAFLLLLSGLNIAFIVFILEIIHFRFHPDRVILM